MINNDIKKGDIVKIEHKLVVGYLKGYWRVMQTVYYSEINRYGTNRYLEKVDVININGKGHKLHIQGHRVKKLDAIDYMKLKKAGII